MAMIVVLRRAAHGAEVELLQKSLRDRGLSTGQIDGRFGPATEAALLAFQRSHGLLADGVAGPVTWRALARVGDGAPADQSHQIDVDFVAELFPFTPLRPIERNLLAVLAVLAVLAALRDARLVDKPMLLMALATIRAESEGFVPGEEAPSRFNTP